jgi:hypothetical protein
VSRGWLLVARKPRAEDGGGYLRYLGILFSKSEIRISKYETNSNHQNTKFKIGRDFGRGRLCDVMGKKYPE